MIVTIIAEAVTSDWVKPVASAFTIVGCVWAAAWTLVCLVR
jgi:hypothetical protein